MASGTLVRGGGGGGDGGDGSREKQRWTESKVYTRKSYNKGNTSSKNLQPSSQTLASEDGNSSQQQLLTRFDAISDDSSSRNRREIAVPSSRDPGSGGFVGWSGIVRSENRVTISLGSRSKQEMRELRRKLSNELDQVRSLVKKLKAKELQIVGFSGGLVGGGGSYSHSQLSANDAVDNGGGKRVNSEVASVGPPESRPQHQLSVSVVENSQGGVSDIVEKEKRTPKANQYYKNSDFVLGKEKFPPPESNKKSKAHGWKKHGGSGGGEGSFGLGKDKYFGQVFKNCNVLLAKLMKHKHGWVFNSPVDVKGLGLHDYYTIVKRPMDLGTVKSRLNKNLYKSAKEFAEDVRLTFRNAMLYNPRGQDVHFMAEELLNIFEGQWAALQAKFDLDGKFEGGDYDVGLPTPTSKKTPIPRPFQEMRNTLDRSESTSLRVDSKSKSSNVAAPSGRTPLPKKPKAKDQNKRDMTFEEKQRLSMNLQSLPPEKLDNIVQIIKKRNTSLCQRDDEIEVDIDVVDAETLWELDRLVTNYKKSLSKNKRKAELAIQAKAQTERDLQEMNRKLPMVEVQKETKTDEGNVSSSSPIQGEKQEDNASRSSSSSSSSSDSGSSSSDSDNDSSSASDVAHSPKT